ncbi:MAG: RNA polymerase sigma factor [Marinifilaceae bacterium]
MKQKEFNKTVLPLSSKIFSYSYRILEDSDEAKDTVQDIMLKLWLMGDEVKRYNNLTGFVIRMCRNHCIDLIRKRNKYVKDQNGELILFAQSQENDILEEKDTFNIVRNIIKQLPSTQQEVVILKDLEGYKTEEIAEITGLGVNNIRVIISRSRKFIKEELINKYQIKGALVNN